MPYTFLSDEWLTEVKALADEAGPEANAMPADLTLNLVVTGGPEGDRELHMAGAPTKLTVPYAVARSMFIEGDQAAAMQAFMSGQIKVEGDMTKLMAMQASGHGDPAAAAALQEKLKAVTALD